MPLTLKSRAGRLVLVGSAAVITVALLLWRHVPARPVAASQPPEVLARDLVQRDGRWFLKTATNVAFTGVMVQKSPSGSLSARVEISHGLADGWSVTWYTNGQARLREHFKNGVSNGPREKWFANGQKQSAATIVDGKVTGIFQCWHENGQLAEKIEMKDGQPVGVAWAYYPSGFVKAETTLAAGRPLNQRSWKDGELKALQ